MVGLRWFGAWLWVTAQSSCVRLLSRRLTVRLTGAAVATGGLALMGVGTVGSPAVSNGFALQASNGDNNAGDIFLDNIALGPGGEHDPHLGCPTTIIVGGMHLADASGTYVIDGWPPSGSQEQDYASTWHYDTATGGTQTISLIDVATLLANAVANGDTPRNRQGYHFKIQFSQDPQKHKTFWINCETETTTSSTSSVTSSTPGASTSTSSTTSSTSTTPSTSTESTNTTTTVGAPGTKTVTSPTTTTVTAPTTVTQTVGTTVTAPVTVTAPGATTVTAPGSSTSSSASSSPSSTPTTGIAGSRTTAGAGGGTVTSGVRGISAPSTGADVEFGAGLGLLVLGGALLAGGSRFGRKPHNKK